MSCSQLDMDGREALEQVGLLRSIEPEVVNLHVVDPHFAFAHQVEADAHIGKALQRQLGDDDGAARPVGAELQAGRLSIASRAEFTPKNVQTRDERVKLVYRVKVGLQNDDGLFKPGMPAEARF